MHLITPVNSEVNFKITFRGGQLKHIFSSSILNIETVRFRTKYIYYRLLVASLERRKNKGLINKRPNETTLFLKYEKGLSSPLSPLITTRDKTSKEKVVFIQNTLRMKFT